MSNKNVLILFVALLVIGIGLFALAKQSGVFHQLPRNYIWSFSDEGQDEFGTPHTAVSLLVNGTKHDLGTVDGTCTNIDGGNWSFLENEKSGSICYFAGGGTEFGVFEEGGKLVVKKGYVDEGSAETSGSRSGFETLFAI